MCICTHSYMYVYIYVCVYIYIYIYICQCQDSPKTTTPPAPWKVVERHWLLGAASSNLATVSQERGIVASETGCFGNGCRSPNLVRQFLYIYIYIFGYIWMYLMYQRFWMVDIYLVPIIWSIILLMQLPNLGHAVAVLSGSGKALALMQSGCSMNVVSLLAAVGNGMPKCLEPLKVLKISIYFFIIECTGISFVFNHISTCTAIHSSIYAKLFCYLFAIWCLPHFYYTLCHNSVDATSQL